MTWAIYLTHPEVVIDANVPVPEWGLSETGQRRARLAILLDGAQYIKRVVSSTETKALETAQIFADAYDLEVHAVGALHENDRSATGFLPPEEFEKTADQFFAEPDRSIRGWETAADAQHRIVSGIQAVCAGIPNEDPILFTGHGGVGTLLKCHLMGAPISRVHDQIKAGSWYKFEKEWLENSAADALDWNIL